MNQTPKLSPNLIKATHYIFALLKVASLLLLFWSIYQFKVWIDGQHYLLFSEGQKVEGRIVEVTKHVVVGSGQTDRSHLGYTAFVPTVEFMDLEGTHRKFIDNFGSSAALKVGDKVLVLFAKSNSQIAILDKGPLKNWLGLIFSLAAFLGGLLGLKKFSGFNP